VKLYLHLILDLTIH